MHKHSFGSLETRAYMVRTLIKHYFIDNAGFCVKFNCFAASSGSFRDFVTVTENYTEFRGTRNDVLTIFQARVGLSAYYIP